MKRREKYYRAPPKRCPDSGKRCIPEHEVDHAVRALQTKNQGRAYFCEACEHYHLTSVPIERVVNWMYRGSDEEADHGDRH